MSRPAPRPRAPRPALGAPRRRAAPALLALCLAAARAGAEGAPRPGPRDASPSPQAAPAARPPMDAAAAPRAAPATGAAFEAVAAPDRQPPRGAGAAGKPRRPTSREAKAARREPAADAARPPGAGALPPSPDEARPERHSPDDAAAAGRGAAAAAKELARAKELFNAGARAYDAGHFEAAARVLQEAYGLAPRPAILFSMAQAERQHYTLSHDPAFLARATQHYRQYIERAPQGARRVDAALALTELELLAARASAGAARAPAKPGARVLVTSPAPSASARLDGGRPAPTPLVEEVAPGRHRLFVEAPGYVPEERLIAAAEGDMVTMHVPLRELPAVVAFAGAPPGARVSVDGRDVGTAPLAPLRVSPGRHTVAVVKPGWQPFSREVLLGRGESAVVRVETGPTALHAATYALVVASGAALIAGGAFLGVALRHESQASKIYYDERGARALSVADGLAYAGAREARDDWRARGSLALGAGAGFALGAAALYAVDASAAPPPARALSSPRRAPGEPGDELSLRPFVAPGLGGLALGGRF